MLSDRMNFLSDRMDFFGKTVCPALLSYSDDPLIIPAGFGGSSLLMFCAVVGWFRCLFRQLGYTSYLELDSCHELNLGVLVDIYTEYVWQSLNFWHVTSRLLSRSTVCGEIHIDKWAMIQGDHTKFRFHTEEDSFQL